MILIFKIIHWIYIFLFDVIVVPNVFSLKKTNRYKLCHGYIEQFRSRHIPNWIIFKTKKFHKKRGLTTRTHFMRKIPHLTYSGYFIFSSWKINPLILSYRIFI